MATYTVNFQNKTDRTWTMAVYQTLPNSIGLDSVAWLQTTAQKGAVTGVRFDLTYNVVLGDFSQNGGRGVYSAVQLLSAGLGTAWEVVVGSGVQQLRPAGAASQPQQILIRNSSDRLANPGIGMSGSPSVYQRSLSTGASVQFQVTPTYWVGLFDNLQRGEVITSNVPVGPLQLRFPSGVTSATLTASLNGDSIVLTLSYGNIVSATLEEIDTREKSLEFSRGADGQK